MHCDCALDKCEARALNHGYSLSHVRQCTFSRHGHNSVTNAREYRRALWSGIGVEGGARGALTASSSYACSRAAQHVRVVVSGERAGAYSGYIHYHSAGG